MNSREYDDLLQRIEVLREKGMSRRDIIKLAAGALSGSALAAVLAACGGSGGGAENTPTTSRTGGAGASPGASSASPAAGGSAAIPEPANEVEIEYWQYAYDSKVKLVNDLIPKFQQQHPKIKVKHVNFPYDSFQQKVQAAVQAGTGPDVLNVYYGWVPAYYLANFLKALPEQYFPAATLKNAFFPMLSTVQFGGSYYALPTAVRTLGLFWNKDLLKEAGYDTPPATWQETVDLAVKTTKRGSDGKLQQAGMTWDPSGQGHSWWRSCLTRQNGCTPISSDNKTLHWTDAGCLEAFNWYLDLNRKYKTGEQGFYTDGATAFQTGHAALHIDGSYRVGTLKANAPNLNYSIAVLPKYQAQASYASFWCNTITRRAQGDRELAAAAFIQYLASPEVMKQWTPAIGELPARVELAKDPEFTKDDKLAAFLDQLPYSYADFFVDEAQLRQAVLDAIDKVLLKNVDAKQALTEAQDAIQKEFNDYWAKVATK